MKIQNLHLNQYKRFYDLTIDLGENPKRIIALVGPNGCGKSSVFDAMIYLMNSRRQIGSGRIKDYKYHSLEQDPKYNYKNIKINFYEGNFDSVFKEKQKTGTENTIFSFRSSYRYNNNLDVKQTKAVSGLSRNDYGASYSSDLDERIEQNYRRLYIKYNQYLNDKDCRPSEAKEHIIGELNDAIGHCLSLCIENMGDVGAGEGTLFFKKEDSDYIFPFDVLSSGEKEVVDILLDVYIRRDEYIDSIYIFDEPELHINTSIQRTLLNEINKMVPENCQIWIATHSIGFLRALQEDFNDCSQIIVFDEKNLWASQSYTLVPMERNRTNWLKLFSTALDDLAFLVAPDCIVYCEGKDKPDKNNEEQGIDAQVYNIIFNEKHPDTVFVSSGGNTELEQRSDIAISVLSKAFIKVNIWLLKDRDMASGKYVSEDDRQSYLREKPDSHRVLRRLEIENYLYDKEVLKEYCSKSNLQFNDEKYNELVTDIVNDNVKDKTGKIKQCCGINFSIGVNAFKKELALCISPNMSIYKELEEEIFERK